MMKSLEMNEFIERIDEMLRIAVEEGETIEIIKQGEAIAYLLPVHEDLQTGKRELSALWADLDRLSAEISTHWPEGLSAVDAVRDVRREL